MRDKVWVGNKDVENQNCETLNVIIHSNKHKVSCDQKKTILENLLEGGIDAPYSCMSGSCMACLGKVTKGRVFMDELFILAEENINAGECLTCQSFPASKEIEINYDEV